MKYNGIYRFKHTLYRILDGNLNFLFEVECCQREIYVITIYYGRKTLHGSRKHNSDFLCNYISDHALHLVDATKTTYVWNVQLDALEKEFI